MLYFQSVHDALQYNLLKNLQKPFLVNFWPCPFLTFNFSMAIQIQVALKLDQGNQFLSLKYHYIGKNTYVYALTEVVGYSSTNYTGLKLVYLDEEMFSIIISNNYHSCMYKKHTNSILHNM